MSAIFYASYALLWLLVIFESLLLLGVVRAVYHGRAEPNSPSKRVVKSGALVGEHVPHFEAFDLSGRRIDEDSLPNTFNALLFVSTDCVSCMASLDEINLLKDKVAGSLMIVCRDGLEACQDLSEAYELDGIPVIVDEDRRVSKLFDVVATPTAVLIGANRRIRTYGHPVDKDELASMIAAGEVHSFAQDGATV